jgi:HTH-type transcriptional regulator/antitoxin HipB
MSNAEHGSWRTLEATRFRDIGAAIKAVREDLDIPQDVLADELGFSRHYLSAIENGKPNLYITRLFRLLRRLNIQVDIRFQLDVGANRRG